MIVDRDVQVLPANAMMDVHVAGAAGNPMAEALQSGRAFHIEMNAGVHRAASGAGAQPAAPRQARPLGAAPAPPSRHSPRPRAQSRHRSRSSRTFRIAYGLIAFQPSARNTPASACTPGSGAGSAPASWRPWWAARARGRPRRSSRAPCCCPSWSPISPPIRACRATLTRGGTGWRLVGFAVEHVLVPALSIALFSSLSSLLPSITADDVSGAVHDSHRRSTRSTCSATSRARGSTGSRVT
jgi:hypothetical protein